MAWCPHKLLLALLRAVYLLLALLRAVKSGNRGLNRAMWDQGLSVSVRAGASRTHPFPGPLRLRPPLLPAARALRHTEQQPARRIGKGCPE